MRYIEIIENLSNLLKEKEVLTFKLSEMFEKSETRLDSGEAFTNVLGDIIKIKKIAEINQKAINEVSKNLHIEIDTQEFAEKFCERLNRYVAPYSFNIVEKNIYKPTSAYKNEIFLTCDSLVERKKFEKIMKGVESGKYAKNQVGDLLKMVDIELDYDKMLKSFSQRICPRLDLNTDLGKLIYEIGEIDICSAAEYGKAKFDLIKNSCKPVIQIYPVGDEKICAEYLTTNTFRTDIQKNLETSITTPLFSKILKEIVIEKLDQMEDTEMVGEVLCQPAEIPARARVI